MQTYYHIVCWLCKLMVGECQSIKKKRWGRWGNGLMWDAKNHGKGVYTQI